MKKIYNIAIILLIPLLLLACYMPTPPVPANTPTPVKTQTFIPPAVATQLAQPQIIYFRIDCPSNFIVPLNSDARCYLINLVPVVVGLTYYENNIVEALAISWHDDSTNEIINKASAFIIEQADIAGWDLEDLSQISERMGEIPQGEKYSYGTIAMEWLDDNAYTTIVYGPVH